MTKTPMIGLLLVLSAAVNAGQAYRILQLNNALNAIADERKLAVGTRVPPLVILDAAGKRSEVRTVGARPLVVYWMSPGCGWCKKNEANIRALAAGVRGKYSLIALTSSARSASGFEAVAHIGMPILGEPDSETARRYRFGGTPQTIVIDSDGTVTKVWTGAYRGTILAEVEQYFGLTLPGLMEDAESPRPLPNTPGLR